ncbi:MAG: molybdate ABC transporter substrate-binding protein [Myxococcota bacterium]
MRPSEAGRFGAIAIALLLGLSQIRCAAHSDALVVLAAASLTESFDDLAARFSSTEGVPVICSYAGSQVLATQVSSGVGADLIATADRASLGDLLDTGRIETPVTFARNRLVWILRRDLHGPPIGSDSDVRRLVLAAPEVPVGRYARAALQRLGQLDPAEAENVSLEADVKGVVSKVLFGVADAGLVYATDVTPAIAERVRVVELPGDAQVKVAYQIAVVAGSRHAARARRFVRWLQSPAARTLLERHGFRSP